MERQHLSQTKKAIAFSNRDNTIARHSPHPIEELQSSIGNRAVNQLLAGKPLVQTKPLFRGISHELAIQPKLTIGAVGDKYEQEADSIAEQVVSQMNAPENSEIQRKEMPEEDEEVQMKPTMQRLGEGNTMAAAPELETSIQQAKSGGKPLPEQIRQPMEQAFGSDFSAVKVHTNTQSHQLNQSIQAQAFTTGKDIFFASGKYNPGSQQGQELIAHELTHVVQQNGLGNHHTANQSIARADRSAEANIETITPNSAKSITQNASPSLKRTIQRKIGFEIETGIPITKEITPGTRYVDPSHGLGPTHILEIPVLGGSKLTPDHIPGHTQNPLEDFKDWPIIEFASAPVDETQSVRTFKRIANTWLDLLVDLRSKVSGTPPPELLSNYVGGSPAGIFMGYPGLQTLEDEQLDRVVIQATVGARLDRLAQPMTAVSTVTSGASSVWDRAGAAGKAVTYASTLIDNVKAQIPPPTLGTFNLVGKSKQRQQIDELRGFLMLISNYLVAGRDVKSGYIKNRTAWFYKSKLSDVCNNLVASNSYANTVLRGTQAAWVKTQILFVNQRIGANDVFIHSPIGLTCQTWLDEVFAGTDDQVFENAKNPWSTDIAPDTVKGRLAAVMEMRSPGVNFDPGKMFKLSTDRDDIVEYLAVLYRAQRSWQDI